MVGGLIENQHVRPPRLQERQAEMLREKIKTLEGRIMDMIFTGLVSYDADGKVVNEIAESIETEDSQNYTIKIKEGQTFSDGSPVTAASFVDAWNFGAAAKNAQLNSYFFESIKGYDEVIKKDAKTDEMEGLKVVDDHTVTV